MSQNLTAFALICCLIVAGTVGAEPPRDNIAAEQIREQGFNPPDLMPSQILEIEGLTVSERLNRSGAELIEYNLAMPGFTDMMPDLSGSPGFGEGTGVAVHDEVVRNEIGDETRSFKRTVPPEEIGRRKVEAGGMTREQFADFLEIYSGSLIMVGGVLSENIPSLGPWAGAPTGDRPEGMPVAMSPFNSTAMAMDCLAWGQGPSADESYAVLPGGVMTDEERARVLDNSWVSPDPLTFLTGPACALAFGAGVMRATDLTEEEKKAAIAEAWEATNEQVQLAGREEVDGRPTYRLEMNDLAFSQTTEDGAQIDFKGAAIWVDEEYFVRRKMRMEGVMHAEGESREFFMESMYQDYRNVPASHLYEPYRTVWRTGGMITPEQQREMQEAMAQLEDFEQQMASMPASQRAMVERMMGDKIDQARSLASGGAVEFEMITTSIVINPDFSVAPSLLDDGPDLVRTIQQGLAELGYDPGPVTGEMNQQTTVAIVRFESARGMEVTGQATPAVAAAIHSASR